MHVLGAAALTSLLTDKLQDSLHAFETSGLKFVAFLKENNPFSIMLDFSYRINLQYSSGSYAHDVIFEMKNRIAWNCI